MTSFSSEQRRYDNAEEPEGEEDLMETVRRMDLENADDQREAAEFHAETELILNGGRYYSW
jgi:hypothetical protein